MLPLTLRALAVTAALAAALPAIGSAAVVPPPANARFDYQIGGAYPPAAGVGIVDRDRSEPPAPGVYGVCYVNGFQAQPEELRRWKAHHRTLLLRSRGRYIVDREWNEVLLDIATPARRRAVAAVVGRWIDECAAAGYQAVEPDNLDSWTRSRGHLNKGDAKAYAALLVARAHAAGLAIGQKNTPELGGAGRKLGFDFAIAEECNVYRECGRFTGPFGDRVYEIEYPDNGGLRNFNAACAARGGSISITYRDRDVKARGRKGYVFRDC